MSPMGAITVHTTYGHESWALSSRLGRCDFRNPVSPEQSFYAVGIASQRSPSTLDVSPMFWQPKLGVIALHPAGQGEMAMAAKSVAEVLASFEFPVEAACSPSDPILREAMIRVFRTSYWGDQQLKPENLHIDHIVPRSMGGPDNIFNYVATVALANLKRGNRVSVETMLKVLHFVKDGFAPRVLKIVKQKRAQIERKKLKHVDKLRRERIARQGAAQSGANSRRVSYPLKRREKAPWDPRDQVLVIPHLSWKPEQKLRRLIAALVRVRDGGRLWVEGDRVTIKATADELIRWGVASHGKSGGICVRHHYDNMVTHHFGTRGAIFNKKYKFIKDQVSVLGPDIDDVYTVEWRILSTFISGWLFLKGPSAEEVLEEFDFGLIGEGLDHIPWEWPRHRPLDDDYLFPKRGPLVIGCGDQIRGLAHVHLTPDAQERAVLAALMNLKARGYLGAWGDYVWGECLPKDSARLGFSALFEALQNQGGRHFCSVEYSTKNGITKICDVDIISGSEYARGSQRHVFSVRVSAALVRRWFTGPATKDDVLAEYDSGLILAEDARGICQFGVFNRVSDYIVGEQYSLNGEVYQVVEELAQENGWNERPWARSWDKAVAELSVPASLAA